MRRLSFIITILGITLLLLTLHSQKPFPQPIQITSKEQLENLTQNQKIILQGQITNEKQNKNSKTLTLNNQIKLSCNCPQQSYKNQNLTITAYIDYFNNKQSLKVLKLSEH